MFSVLRAAGATMMLRNISRGSWTLGFFKMSTSSASSPFSSPSSSGKMDSGKTDGGVGEDDASATRAVMVVNYEHAFTQWASVEFEHNVQEVDGWSGERVPVEDEAPDIPGKQLLFAPGEGRLFVA